MKSSQGPTTVKHSDFQKRTARIIERWAIVVDEHGDHYLSPMKKAPLFFNSEQRRSGVVE